MSWSSVTGFQQFWASPALPEDRVLYSGAAVFPGSFDHRGSPLVIFPRAQHNKLISDLKQADVVELLKYFHLHLGESQTRNGLVSIVTDLRSATLDVVSIIINSLLQVQHQLGKVVDTFYAVQPQAKGIRKHVLKSLGLGCSKQCSELPFKCVLLNEIYELFNYIDRSQLTSDLGGYLIYQHKAWVHFRKEIDGFAHEYFTLAQKFPGCLAGLQQQSLQSLPTEAEELEQFCQHIKELHAAWKRDLGIDDLLRKCEEILEKFRDPKSDPCFNAMAGTTQFQQAADDLFKKDERIRAAVKKVELLRQQSLARAQLSLKDLWCRERAQQITDLIVSEGMEKIHSYKLEIANNLSQAELLKLDYDVAIYNPAMKLIAESEKLLQDLDEIMEAGGRTEDCKEKLSRLKDMFHIAVELPRQTLRAVYDFYDIFEKVAGWYHLLLQEIFFKEAFCDNTVHNLGFPHEAVLCLKPSWQDHVNRFLNKAPLPAVEELVRLGHLADCIPDTLHRRRGKLLSHQCSVVRKLLTSPGQVLLIDLEQAVQWQELYLKAFQNVLVPCASSSIDTGITRGAAEALKTANEHVVQEDFLNKYLHKPNHEVGFELCVSSAEKHFNKTDPIQHSGSCFSSGYIDHKLQLTIPSAHELAGECPNQAGKALSQRPSSSISFASGIDGTGTCNFETLQFNYEIDNGEHGVKRASNSSLITEDAKLNEEAKVGGDESTCQAIDEFGLADSLSVSSEVQSFPKINPNALNFEIKVSRSASLPKNPWISLSVEDLEKSYVVTITPKKPVLETQNFKPTIDGICDMVQKNEERKATGFSGMTPCLNKLNPTETTSFENVATEKEQVFVTEQCAVHTSERFNHAHGLKEQNLDPSKNVENLENENPEIPYDSYEFFGSKMLLEGSDGERKHTGLTEPMTCDWEMEQEKLQNDVEKLLLKTAKILEEEESVLRQENELELLLQLEDGESSDDPEENHSTSDKHQGTMSSGKVMMSLNELSEAGVIGLEDYTWPETGPHEFRCSCTCPHLSRDVEHTQEERGFKHYSGFCSANCTAAPSVPGSHWVHHSDSRLLQELEELNQIEDRILEENLKIRELCCSEEEQSVEIPISHVSNTGQSNTGQSNTSKDRIRFLMELEREKKEVEKMEQSLVREEKMRGKNLKKQPQVSSKTKYDNQKKRATKSSARDTISNLKANPVVEVKSQFLLAGRNLKSNDKCKINAIYSDSSQDPACLKVSQAKLQIGHSRNKVTKTVQSEKSCLQDHCLDLTMNNNVSIREEKNLSSTIDGQIFISPLHNEPCIQSDKIEHEINNGISEEIQVESRQEIDGPDWFALTDECKGRDSVDAEAVYFSPAEGDIKKNGTLHLEVDRNGTLRQSANSPESEIIDSNENCRADCKNQGDPTLQTNQKPKPALRTNVPANVEKLTARAISQENSDRSHGSTIMAKCGNKNKQRLPVPRPRKTIKQCQTKSHPEQYLEGSGPFRKHTEHAETSALVGTCSVSKEPRAQVPMMAGAGHKSNPNFQIGNKNKSQGFRKDTMSKNSTKLPDSPVNVKVEQVDCKKANSSTEAGSLFNSTENRNMCSWGKGSKLVVNGGVCDEGKCNEQHILLCNEVKQEASTICSSSLESRENCIPEMLHCNESRNIGTQKGSVRMTDDSIHLHDFTNQDMYPVFEDCHARVSVTFNPAMSAHTFQASVFKVCDYKTPIVLDTGSGLMKAGFADQELPTTIFPTVIGRPKYESVCHGRNQQDVYIGHNAQHLRGVLSLHYPLEHGIVTNWDEIEQIWHHTLYRQLHVEPEEHPILLTEAAMNPHQNRERMVEIMFETFNVPFSFVAMQAVLALYSAGRTTGIILDSGDGVTHTVPVYEGYSLPHAMQRLNLAGRDLTEHLKKLLKERGYSFNSTAEREIVRDIKEKHCYVAGDYEAELGSPEDVRKLHYILPDGQIITLGDEMFRAPEILFKPEMIGKDHYGIHESLLRSIILCDVDLRKTFVANIILSGGNTMLTGLPARIQNEISSMVPLDLSGHVHVTSPANRDFTVWSGGATLASSSALDCAWISQEEYHEFGPKIVHRKCF
ncbi:uncharacterized protein LOC127574807 isoform X2 [Pristis pectinata]|uniref:uncharacterized protein LOC127574807 isoform X2 n=1 Tax=Pristis pectinata TaxID=685728 RepID=UPI00223CF832|nr:uncharacterized protein LOC127574807 isoform X2 [Pristis pectinata]